MSYAKHENDIEDFSNRVGAIGFDLAEHRKRVDALGHDRRALWFALFGLAAVFVIALFLVGCCGKDECSVVHDDGGVMLCCPGEVCHELHCTAEHHSAPCVYANVDAPPDLHADQASIPDLAHCGAEEEVCCSGICEGPLGCCPVENVCRALTDAGRCPSRIGG